MKKKKIAFLINSMAAAGAEKVTGILVNNLSKEYDVHLLLLNNTIEVDIDRRNVTLKIIDSSKLVSSSRFWDILKIPFIAFKLKKYLNANNIDLCISFLNRSNFIVGFTKKIGWKGKAILCERVHTSSVYSKNTLSGKTGRFLVKHLYKKADLIITNAAGMAVDLKTNYNINNPINVIYNPINLEENYKKSQEDVADFNFTKFCFVLVGRFHEQKNHKLLLDAVHIIKDLDFEVLLIGKGELENDIKDYAVKLGIDSKIKILGFKANAIKYVAKCDCTVMTSNYEGFPNVLLESLACGIPVISTDCPTGPRELLDVNYSHAFAKHAEYLKYGILVPTENKDILATVMKDVYLNREILLKYSTLAKNRMMDFNTDKVIVQFRLAIQSVL